METGIPTVPGSCGPCLLSKLVSLCPWNETPRALGEGEGGPQGRENGPCYLNTVVPISEPGILRLGAVVLRESGRSCFEPGCLTPEKRFQGGSTEGHKCHPGGWEGFPPQ